MGRALEPALNAFAITFAGRIVLSTTNRTSLAGLHRRSNSSLDGDRMVVGQVSDDVLYLDVLCGGTFRRRPGLCPGL